jgi:HD-like signal output (HDOD) protein
MVEQTTHLEVTETGLDATVLEAILRMRDLPAAAPTVHKALKQMEGPDFVMAEVKKTLMSDQAVAARILRLANSAYFGFRSEVHTVSQAVVLLGQERIRTLLQRMLMDKIWLEMSQGRSAAAPLRSMSLATATAACVLSQLLAREDAEEMLLAGLLHNIGELFYLSQFPAEYERACRDRAAAPAVIRGMAAGRAGNLLLESWNLPPLYCVVSEHCDDPLSPACPYNLAGKVAMVHVGKKLAEGLAAGLEVTAAVQRVATDVCATFNFEPDLLAEVYQDLPERMSLEQLQAGRA